MSMIKPQPKPLLDKRRFASARVMARPAAWLLSCVIGMVFSASSMAATAAATADGDNLTWNGVTLYGIYDIGVAYQTHGAPLSQDFAQGLNYLIAKNSNHSITSVAPNALSQSRLGLKGNEKINDDLSLVFVAELAFNPQSGNLSDGVKALTHNNGLALQDQKSGGDSTRAGQLFSGPINAGLSSKTWGALTIGRQVSPLLDGLIKYDAMGGGYAFSVFGFSGLAGGAGSSEDGRLDDALKYAYKLGDFHAAALYQFPSTDSSPGKGEQLNVGYEHAGFSVDAVVAKKDRAISAASLTAAQVAIHPADSLSAVVSDNKAYSLAGSYTTGPWKFFAGYEHITFANPSTPLLAPFSGLGGYDFSVVSNTAYDHHRTLKYRWAGLKYTVSSQFILSAAYYHYDQNSFKGNGCSDASSASCSGGLDAYSLLGEYKLTRRFEMYGGAMYSHASDGLASGFLHTSTIDPTIGFRFAF